MAIKKVLYCIGACFFLVCFACNNTSQKDGRQTYRIATYNVRYQNKADNNNGRSWSERYKAVSELIKKYDFDIVGVQEPFYDQVNDMLNSLPDYHRFGSSDDDLVNSKTNHHHDVFYNTRKFTLLANGKFWLSPNAPVSPPDSLYSAAWGGKAKVCTWGKFKGNYSETVFYVFNAHFYYANKETRIESARLILDQIKKIAGGLPAIFMGDLNLNPDSEAYKILSCSGLLEDSYNWARINLPKDTLLHQTFNKWQTKVLLKESIENNRIDYIFITNQWKNKVKSHSVIWDSYSKDGIDKMPSDHNPVFVELENL